MKALYKYPQTEYPYSWLEHENKARGVEQPEFEIEDTGKKISVDSKNIFGSVYNAISWNLQFVRIYVISQKTSFT